MFGDLEKKSTFSTSLEFRRQSGRHRRSVVDSFWGRDDLSTSVCFFLFTPEDRDAELMMELDPQTESTDDLVAAPDAVPVLVASRVGDPLEEDWFEAALASGLPALNPVRNSWGDDDDAEEEAPEEDEDVEEDDSDPFEDFDEEDFDDDFDDDFEEELEDEYEIEPADDGMLEGHPDAEDIDDEEIDGEDPPVGFADEE